MFIAKKKKKKEVGDDIGRSKTLTVCSDLCIWSCLLDRTGARPSISSKKMMDGRIWYA